MAYSIKFGNLAVAKRKLRYFFLDSSLSYQRDKIDTSHSITLTSYSSWLRSGAADHIWLNIPKHIKGTSPVLFLTCSAGREFLYKFNAAHCCLKGAIGRMYYHVEGRLIKKNFTVKMAILSLSSALATRGTMTYWIPPVTGKDTCHCLSLNSCFTLSERWNLLSPFRILLVLIPLQLCLINIFSNWR